VHEATTGVSALVFDFYGTVVDMQRGLVEVMTPYLSSKGYTKATPHQMVTRWRRTHFENSMIDALLGRDHTPYREIGRQSVHYVLDRADIEHTDSEVRELVSHIERLPPFPDVVDALSRIKQQGLRLVVLSNGDPDMLAAGVRHSGTEALFERVISVAEAGAFKPHHATYATAAGLLDLEPGQILFVANHAFDCVGAKAAGMRTAFIDRRRRPFGNITYPPDMTVADFAELAQVITSDRRQ
jgi:2-haloacid dehalogenase